MILTYNDLVRLVQDGVINAPMEHVNAASIDVTLGDKFLIEDKAGEVVNLARKQTPHFIPLHTNEVELAPGQFILAQTQEVFNLPDDIAAEFKLKSSAARSGLNHALAGWCDPGWHGSTLTLELKNQTEHTWLRLEAGMKIGQIIFFKGAAVPSDKSYAVRGQYNNDRSVTGNKGLR